MEQCQARLFRKADKYKLKEFMATKPDCSIYLKDFYTQKRKRDKSMRLQQRISHTRTVKKLEIRKVSNTIKSTK